MPSAAKHGLHQSPYAQGNGAPRVRLKMTNFNSFLEEYQSAWRRKNISNQEHGLLQGHAASLDSSKRGQEGRSMVWNS